MASYSYPAGGLVDDLGGAHSGPGFSAGGYEIRPYGPALGLFVGVGFIPARNLVPIRSGVRQFLP